MAVVTSPTGVFSKAEFDAIVAQGRAGVGPALVKLAGDATTQPCRHRVPISDYYVAAALLAADGRVFIGRNLEIDDLSDSMHAEQSALHHAVSEGARLPVIRVGITKPPCGLCRQILSETHRSQELLVDVEDTDIASTPLPQLLPTAFTPAVVGKHSIGERSQGEALRYGAMTPHPAPVTPLEEATHTACIHRSLSCWMEAPAAVGLELRSGEVVVGVFIESVAHNPTILPATGAANKVLLRGHSLEDVVRAAIAYCPSPRLDHEGSARRLLGKLCPHLTHGATVVIREVKQASARL
eukprot:TRINITY_DN14987_c0_g1_i1.p1 TRINITY_DN14987_c0_g1~~TRINITY_DN14987_c0_g1_i1.p1  ORF type:complete len:297 (+),score=77.58 TRINITY_DN14987_c0_g1_i1:51-941(+)